MPRPQGFWYLLRRDVPEQSLAARLFPGRPFPGLLSVGQGPSEPAFFKRRIPELSAHAFSSLTHPAILLVTLGLLVT
jgi:hypothetical protein